MKLLIDKNTKAIIDIGEIVESKINGIFVNGINGECIYATGLPIDVVDVAIVPVEVKIQEYCYTVEKGFYKNTNYVPYVSKDQKIINLQNQINSLNLAMANMMGV